ncbi:hypothetical protein HYX12_00535 [Candidatus Woesearchaeota archaeon]|nr:hypothetical protein [Candidatus Woesearchaeota archaeon]
MAKKKAPKKEVMTELDINEFLEENKELAGEFDDLTEVPKKKSTKGTLLSNNTVDKNLIDTPKLEVNTNEEQIEPNNKISEGKIILISIIIIIAMLAFTLGGFKVYNKITGATVTITLEDLHNMNREGKLDESRGYMYNGFSFVKNEGLWWAELRSKDTLLKVPLHFGPKEVESISISGKLDDVAFNQGEKVFIAIDPNVTDKYYTLALSELSFNIVKGLDRIPVGSCTEKNDICTEREIINCQNSKGKPVVELRLGEPKIELLGTCILVSGQEYDIVKAADRLLFQWYGVMG